jgi:hypothetical protein
MSDARWLELRAQIGKSTGEFNAVLKRIDGEFDMTAGSERVLKYLILRTGEIVTKEELRGVAGIHEFARRIRELREDHGWPIHSSVTRPSLGVGEYLLESATKDPNLVANWAAAKAAARLSVNGVKLSNADRILNFLQATFPRTVERDQLRHVVGQDSIINQALQSLQLQGWPVNILPLDDLSAPSGASLASLHRNH